MTRLRREISALAAQAFFVAHDVFSLSVGPFSKKLDDIAFDVAVFYDFCNGFLKTI